MKRKNLLITLTFLLLVSTISAMGQTVSQMMEWQNYFKQTQQFLQAQKFDKAIESAHKTVEKAEAYFSSYDQKTAYSYFILAQSYQANEQFEEAEPYFIKMLGVAEKKFDEDEPDLLQPLFAVGNNYVRMKNYEKAVEYIGRAYNISEKTYGKDSSDMVPAINMLARTRMAMEDFEEAEKLFRQASEIYEKTNGKESELYLRSLFNIANMKKEQYKYTEAENIYTEIVDIAEKADRNKLEIADYKQGLAEVKREQHKYDAAMIIYQKIMQTRLKYQGKSHPEAAWAMLEFAISLENQHKFSNAKYLFKKAYENALDSLEDKKRILSIFKYYIGINNVNMGETDEAVESLKEAIEMRNEAFKNTPEKSSFLYLNLAYIHDKLGNEGKSDSLAKIVVDLLTEYTSPEDKETSNYIRLSGIANMFTGNYEEAVKKMTMNKNYVSEKIGESSFEYAEALTELGEVYVEKTDFAAAVPLLEQAMNIAKNIFPEKPAYYEDTIFMYGKALKGAGQTDKATEALNLALETRKSKFGEKHFLVEEVKKELQ